MRRHERESSGREASSARLLEAACHGNMFTAEAHAEPNSRILLILCQLLPLPWPLTPAWDCLVMPTAHAFSGRGLPSLALGVGEVCLLPATEMMA